MSGPSHGSPVGDSLWYENDQSVDAGARRRRARAVSSSCSSYGSPSLEDARRQAVRGEDDVRVGAADAVGEELDEARLVVPALDEPRARRGPRAPSSSCCAVAGDREPRVVRREHEADDACPRRPRARARPPRRSAASSASCPVKTGQPELALERGARLPR